MLDRLSSAWFQKRGWSPFPFQIEAWQAIGAGASGLVHAPTGLGKTYALWFPVLEFIQREQILAPRDRAFPLTALWITPLRALAEDTLSALLLPVQELELPITVEKRTGDSSAATRRRQASLLPTCLITTPESLSLLLSYPDWRQRFQNLRFVFVDEWHELLSTKRGVQTELALARLRRAAPHLVTWGCSATLSNLEEAATALCGIPSKPRLISASLLKQTVIETLLPPDMECFPWSGHLGTRMVPQVCAAINNARSTLLFTNTRAQAEHWFRAVTQADPGVQGKVGIHHGSIDRDSRNEVEAQLNTGSLRAVVCTSSLDLGVDFSPVDQVIQVGSPKGVARLLQRAGRSGHQPGGISRIVGVPTHAVELIEFAAARAAITAGQIEPRHPIERPLDVLLQHLITVGVGGGFEEEELLAEIRSTLSYRNLNSTEWAWALDFLTAGGNALSAYPDFHKLKRHEGRYGVEDQRLIRIHRMSIGTITSDGSVTIKLQRGGTLGSVEETFLSRLKPGETFQFGGRHLELVRLHGFVATVRQGRKKSGPIPSWQGGRSPLSSELAEALRLQLANFSNGRLDSPELTHARSLLEIQSTFSALPLPGTLLVEVVSIRRKQHLFIYPFGGRLVHEGLATLVAWRISNEEAVTLRATCNDYGFALEASQPLQITPSNIRRWLATEDLLPHLLACINSTELARRQFREISRIAGLVLQGAPGKEKSARQFHASSSLLFDVFVRYDPANQLLDQAKNEILSRQLDLTRLSRTLTSCERDKLQIQQPARLTPLAFPLWAAKIAESVSSESFNQQIDAMLRDLGTPSDRR
ncbi:MAG: ligase-associated DNA damage response DEXH box helicase [Puniceicoccaceae bacterium]